MKSFFLTLAVLASAVSFGQKEEELNNYQFAIVPAKFSFFKKVDQYSLNTYTKMYMQKFKFKAFLDSEDLPLEANDRCSRIYVDVIENNNVFVTSVRVRITDCMGNILYETNEGKSRTKEYQPAYREALAEAFKSFETVAYEYNGNNGISVSVATGPGKTVASKSEPAQTPSVKKDQPVDKNTLFAQPVENGYQLVDTTPSVVFKLQKTSSTQVFLAQKGNLTGTLIDKGGVWTFEYYDKGELKTEQVKIKF